MTAHTPQSYKSKGRSFQQFVAAELRQAVSLPEADIVSRPMGSQGMDIMLSAKARQMIPFAIECKRAEHWEISAWWRQACANASSEHMEPALIIRESRRPPYVMIYTRDFDYLLAADTTQSTQWHEIKKRSAAWKIKAWISETEQAAGTKRSPKLTISRPGEYPVCIIQFRDFCRLLPHWAAWNTEQLAVLSDQQGGNP